MGLLQDKKILIMGVLSNRSIAYGIAKSCAAQGARLAFTYQNERFEQRVKDLAQTLGSDRLYPCDVSDDAAIASLFERLALDWDRLDGLVHAIAFAPREAIAGDFLEGVSREAFRIAHDVSSYSLIAVCKQAQSMLVKAALIGRDPVLSWSRAHGAQLQYDGFGKSKPGSRRSISCRIAQPSRCARECDFGRTHQDACSKRHQGLFEDSRTCPAACANPAQCGP